MIRIKSNSTRVGCGHFRRCGVEHPLDWTEYPDDRFTKEELAILKAEPNLTVEVVKENGR